MKASPLLFTFLLACSGGTSVSPDALVIPDAPPPDPNVLLVAGSYPTAVTLGRNDCNGINVQNNTTNITQIPGAAELVLSHAGNSYPGTVQRNGAFATPARPVGPSSETHNVAIAGTFTPTGFTAAVTVNVTVDGVQSCSYAVSWVGTKTGPPNVIPE